MRRSKSIPGFAAVLESAEQWSVIHGDCHDVLREMPDECVHSVVTDPPSGISFMGKKWDSDKGGRDQWVEWLTVAMSECLRVTKPGGHAVVWALPRTSHWTGLAIERAGWKIRDVIVHVQSEGMPKGGLVHEEGWEGFAWNLKPTSEFWFLARKPFKGSAKANLVKNGCGALNIEECRVKHANAADLETHRAQVEAIKTRGGVRGGSWANDSNLSGVSDVTPSGRWPANLVLSHAVGCTNTGPGKVHNSSGSVAGGERGNRVYGAGETRQPQAQYGDADGNETVDVWDCVDGCPVRLLAEQSGHRPSTLERTGRGGPNPSKIHAPRKVLGGTGGGGYVYGDTGTAAKYFLQFEPDPFVYFPKPSPSEKNRGGESTHPTVKSIALMRYLCRLVTPPGGIVLDPFSGSGTTVVAAIHEGLRAIGIEKDEDNEGFVEQSRSRIVYEATRVEVKKKRQEQESKQLVIPGT